MRDLLSIGSLLAIFSLKSCFGVPISSHEKLPEKLPVIFMHGIFDSYHVFDAALELMKKERPQTFVKAIDMYSDFESMAPMSQQVSKGVEILRNITQGFDSYHLLCHSQGTLICRGMLEEMDDHRVDTFFAVTGPMMGQFGIPETWLHWLPAPLNNVTTDQIFRMVYKSYFQDTLSIANYWKDPNHLDMYLADNIFLPMLNNEVQHSDSARFRSNFLRVRKVTMFASPDDTVIYPWYSALFDFIDEKWHRIRMREQPIYLNDTFGLMALDKRAALESVVVPGIYHSDWIRDTDTFSKYILPRLT